MRNDLIIIGVLLLIILIGPWILKDPPREP